jgi:hypothetical protein
MNGLFRENIGSEFVALMFLVCFGVGLVRWVQKNFFRVKVLLFCLCSERFCRFCMVSLSLFTFALWCGSAWFVVRFNMLCGALWHGCAWLLGRLIGGSA